MTTWRKSSFSNGSGGNNCVEVALSATGAQVFVRSSRDRRGPMVGFTKDEWRAFLAGVRSDEFDIDALEP